MALSIPPVPSISLGSPVSGTPSASPREWAGSVEMMRVLSPSSARATPSALFIDSENLAVRIGGLNVAAQCVFPSGLHLFVDALRLRQSRNKCLGFRGLGGVDLKLALRLCQSRIQYLG